MVWSHVPRYLITQLIIGLLSLNFPDLTHFIVVFLCRWRQTWGTYHRRTTWLHASYSASMPCHFGFEEKVVVQHPLLCGFMRGASLKLPASKTLTTFWSTGAGGLEDDDSRVVISSSEMCRWDSCAHQAGTGLSSGSTGMTLQTNLILYLKCWGHVLQLT